MHDAFHVVGIRPMPEKPLVKQPWYRGKPVWSMAVLGMLLLGCILCDWFIPADPTFMDLYQANTPPCSQFWFGTDALGRDVFSMIWYGGRLSLLIGFGAAALSTVLAIVIGAVSGLAPRWADELIMRLTDIFLSIPSLLLLLFLQALFGKANVWSITLVLGVTAWPQITKVVRTEVRQLRTSEHVTAARCMGAGFWRILWRHLTPNFMSGIMFMVVMNVRGAIVAESTLSFLGLGLPLETVTWGSMLSLAQKALLSGQWWVILIPGLYLVITILCLTNIGNDLQGRANRR